MPSKPPLVFRYPGNNIRHHGTTLIALIWILLILSSNHAASAAFQLRRPPKLALSVSASQRHGIAEVPKQLVLIGGGHAHLQVIKALNHKSRPNDMTVTVIDRQTSASYSGMVPGCVARLYTPDDTLIQLEPLTEWANIRFLQDEVVDVDLERNCIHLRNSVDPIPFDCVSFDIGSTTSGLDQVPGVREYAIPTRPISELIRHIEDAEVELLAKIQNKNHDKERQEVNVVIVGGGPAGVELSMSFVSRWRPLLGKQLSVTLLDAGSVLLPNESPACRTAVIQVLADRGIQVVYNCDVKEIAADRIHLDGGRESVPYTHCIWATGAAPHRLAGILRKRGLSVNDRGWIQVKTTLQSLSHPHVFAAGDCSSIEGLPKGPPPKAGVYAVRAGPVIIENLINYLFGRPMTKYQPQDDFMKLLVCGDGTALGFRFGFPFYGKWVWQLKNRIDQNFLDLFKAENLPNLEDGAPIDTSQYDARRERRRPPLPPLEAAELLQRIDDNVDYMEAWDVLRDMAESDEYRKQVVKFVDDLRLSAQPMALT